jgi:hypothetical protein
MSVMLVPVPQHTCLTWSTLATIHQVIMGHIPLYGLPCTPHLQVVPRPQRYKE